MGIQMAQMNLFKNVDREKMYKHILEIEGVKHAIDAPEKLNEVADYIKNEFSKYGLEVREQEFTIENFDFTFRNIEALIGEGDVTKEQVGITIKGIGKYIIEEAYYSGKKISILSCPNCCYSFYKFYNPNPRIIENDDSNSNEIENEYSV